MKSNTRSLRSAAMLGTVLSLAVLCVPRHAGAQSFDHLKCYPIRDSAQRQSITTDLVPLDGIFVDDNGSQLDRLLGKGCRVLLPAREICIAVDASTSSETPQPTPSVAAAAAAETGDFLCYQLHCSESNERARVSVTDSFGTRQIDVLDRPSRLCAPATRNGTPPTPEPTTTPVGTATPAGTRTPVGTGTPAATSTPIPIQTPSPTGVSLARHLDG